MADELDEAGVTAAAETEHKKPVGKFQEALYRNNKKIRQDRADTIGRGARVAYKRSIEDLGLEIEQSEQDLENLLDLSPTHADSLVLASDFNAADFVAKDQALRDKIYNDKIRLRNRIIAFEELFGEKLSV